MGLVGLMPGVAFLFWLAGAALSTAAALWIWRHGERVRPDRKPLMVAAGLSAMWCAMVAWFGHGDAAAACVLVARNLALTAAIFSLFAADGRSRSMKPIRPVILALVLVQLLQPVVLLIGERAANLPGLVAAVFEVRVLTDMLVAIGVLLLLHNLYAGAASGLRPILRWTGIALAGIFVYDLNLAMAAYLSGQDPAILSDLRGLFVGAMAGLFALGMNAAGPRVQFSPSRAVTFRTLSLLLIGGYLMVMVLVTKSLALIGGDIARASQIVFVVLALVGAAVALPSPRMRRWLRVMATKHLFQHRYDYRAEWLRFTRTIGHGGAGQASLQERAVQALADITESPAGILLMPNEEAQLELTARWNWPMIAVPAVAAEYGLSSLLEQHQLVISFDEVRRGIDHYGEQSAVPSWLIEAEDAWALVPLLHFDRLVGAIVLSRPQIERHLDWEDFDLLRVAGQQLASYLSEQAGQQALMDASRFDEFNRRMAFVMHDIKNLASQLSLLSSNAEKHADNPAFRADMLITLRNSTEKLSMLLARLGRYGQGQVHGLEAIALLDLAQNLANRFRAVHPVALTREQPVMVMGNREALEQALIHLIQNAIDASKPDMPVSLDITTEGLRGTIAVIDSGLGMSPEFVRTGLFKPFVSSKPGGFGIGAFEAREMVRAMGGRVAVESCEGLGSRFSVSLPIADAVRLAEAADHHTSLSQRVA